MKTRRVRLDGGLVAAVIATSFAYIGCGDSGGSAGPAKSAGECKEVCEMDGDCAELLVCDDGKCSCGSDALCQVGELWNIPGCTSDDECTNSAAPRCVEWGGTTFCVPDNSTDFNCGLSSPFAKVTVDLADQSGTIETCVDTDIVCLEDGECGPDPASYACADDDDCNFEAGQGRPHCDVTSGLCTCVEDPADSCTAAHPGQQCKTDGTCGCLEDDICPFETGGHCFLDTGECGCTSDDQCFGSNICFDGQCRCTTDGAFTCGVLFTENPGTTYSCVPL